MKTRVDALLLAEMAAFTLRFTCEHCVHFEPEARACSHGYPSEAHREPPLEPGADLSFCKEFELV